MTHPEDIQQPINDFLRERLQGKAHCIKGRLECEWPGSVPIMTLSGVREDGKTIYFWDPEPVLRQLANQYRKTMTEPESLAGFTVQADFMTGEFVYGRMSVAQKDHQLEKEEKEQAQQAALQKNELKKRLQSLTEKYGMELAERTADGLKKSSLYFLHRDYCGMGLKQDYAGTYHYGEVWDNDLTAKLSFPERGEFVKWLSQQSDASLARLEEKDSWYWGNQVINRQRLEEFVTSR